MAKNINLSIREARRLDQDVEEVIARITGEIKTSKSVSIFKPLSETAVKEAQSAILTGINNARQLIQFRFQIRAEVKAANAGKIDSLTLSLAVLESQLDVLQGVITATPEEDRYGRYRAAPPKAIRRELAESVDVTLIQAQQAAQVEAQKNGGQVATSLEVNLLTKNLISSLDQEASITRREISKVKDTIALTNQTMKVEINISDDVQQLLNLYAVSVG